MRLVESPRQCVFAGTVNQNTYLRDETGGRRFWPTTCGQITVDELARDRDQLWAEAKVRFDSGEPWWLDTAELVRMASDQQLERYETDPWEEVIAPWIEDCPSVSISEVLEKCLQKPHALWTQTDKNRAGRCLRALGFVLSLVAQERPDNRPCSHCSGFSKPSLKWGSESIHITFYQLGTEGTVGTRRRASHLPAKIGRERPVEHGTRQA
jgi:hypothetical protein